MKLDAYYAVWVAFLSLLLITACVSAYLFFYDNSFGDRFIEYESNGESFSIVKNVEIVSGEAEYSPSSILGRPLFWEARRPVVFVDKVEESPVSQQVKDPVDPFNNFTLLGVFLNNQFSGIVYEDLDASSRLAVGEGIYGAWLLSEVHPTYVVFEKNRGSSAQARRFDLEYALEPSRYAMQKENLQIDTDEPQGNDNEGN